jgi:hypothetical protein
LTEYVATADKTLFGSVTTTIWKAISTLTRPITHSDQVETGIEDDKLGNVVGEVGRRSDSKWEPSIMIADDIKV